MSAFEEEKGLVGIIRGATESEVFDLAGYTESRCQDLIEKAFGSPLESCTCMVKFTFTIGGGKLVRSRYDESMSKWIISALKKCEFSEDRSAACDYISQGTFKQQHDTGQNLKTIAIFPRVACANKSQPAEGEESSDQSPVSTKDSAIISADFSTFCEIISSKTNSWSQRKRVLRILQDYRLHFEELQAKLVRGEMLTPLEQSVYDLDSGCDSEKVAWIQVEVKALVDKGKLTSSEKKLLLQSMEDNISALGAELEGSSSEKVVSRLKEKREKMASRLAVVGEITPITHKLRKSEEILKVHFALHDIHLLEDKGRSMSLTLADLKKIEPKFDLEQQVLQLQLMSRCWFENDEEFAVRCEEDLANAKAKIARKVTTGGPKKKTSSSSIKSGNRGGSSAGSWSTKSTGGSSRGGSNSRTSKPLTVSKGGGFAAAFGSDSDSD